MLNYFNEYYASFTRTVNFTVKITETFINIIILHAFHLERPRHRGPHLKVCLVV